MSVWPKANHNTLLMTYLICLIFCLLSLFIILLIVFLFTECMFWFRSQQNITCVAVLLNTYIANILAMFFVKEDGNVPEGSCLCDDENYKQCLTGYSSTLLELCMRQTWIYYCQMKKKCAQCGNSNQNKTDFRNKRTDLGGCSPSPLLVMKSRECMRLINSPKICYFINPSMVYFFKTLTHHLPKKCLWLLFFTQTFGKRYPAFKIGLQFTFPVDCFLLNFIWKVLAQWAYESGLRNPLIHC